MVSPGMAVDNAAVVNYTGCAPFGPDRTPLLQSADEFIDNCLLKNKTKTKKKHQGAAESL